MIRDYSDLDLKSPSQYGMRPLLDFDKTCYQKAFSRHLVSGADDSDVADFLFKLEQACGCDVPDSLKSSILNVIEEHCKTCVPPIPIDLFSLGGLSDDLKKLFSKLMNHVYSFKEKSRELVVKVLKEFADYESSSDPHIPSPEMPSASENVNGIPGTHVSQANVVKVDRAASLSKDLNVSPVGTKVGTEAVSNIRGTSSKRAPQEDISQLHDRFPKSVRRGHHSVISSKSIPAHGVDDVIPIVKEHENDPEADRFNSPDQSIGTLPFSDDESPNLSKKLPPVCSPEVTIVGLRTLPQKLKMMGKKSEIVYNSRFQKSSSGLVSPHKSASKISGYPSVIPNKFGDSSSKSDFKLPESSTGGKAPLHGPRRTVKPSRVLGDEFEIERAKFKVNKSQILNYKAICNLAKSHQSGEDAILFGVVRCTYWSLGESMKPGGVVNNFVMAAFCYHLYSRPGGHPEVSKCHYFFSSIGEKLLKDVDSASEDILSRAFTRSSKARPLHRSNLFFPCFYDEHWFIFIVDIKDQSFVFLNSYFVLQSDYQVHVRDKLIPNFKYWWAKLVMLDMGFQMYKVVYPFVPPQPLRICDSGVYAMMFLEYWKSPRSSLFTPFKDSDIPNLRIKLANELLFFSKNTRRKDLVTSYQFEDGEDA